MPEHAGLKFTVPAMRILENEHRYLSFLMEEWHDIVLWFEGRSPLRKKPELSFISCVRRFWSLRAR